MGGFINSSRADNIFYADIFVINKKGCLVMGYGKSKACRNYTGESTKEIGCDFACITEDDKNVYGHFEMNIRAEGVPDPIGNRVKLDYFIRMLDEEETKNYGMKYDVKEITLDEYIELCEHNITFAMNGFMPYNDLEKKEYFTQIVKGKDVKCILIPWCDSLEKKGTLISKAIK